jgi:hypothetical protein
MQNFYIQNASGAGLLFSKTPETTSEIIYLEISSEGP